jgi:hypothetical protein
MSSFQEDRDFTPADYQSLNPSGLRSLGNAMEFIKNPRKMCHEIAGYVQRMCEIIRWHKLNNTGGSHIHMLRNPGENDFQKKLLF